MTGRIGHVGKLTPARVVALLDAGRSQNEVARMACVAAQRISQVARDYRRGAAFPAIPTPRHRVGRITVSEALARMAAGESPRRVAKDAGCSGNWMWRIAREHGVNNRARRPAASPLADPEAAIRAMTKSEKPITLVRRLVLARGVKTAAKLAAETGITRNVVLGVWRMAVSAERRLLSRSGRDAAAQAPGPFLAPEDALAGVSSLDCRGGSAVATFSGV